MTTLRTRSTAFVLSTLFVTALAWWGCGSGGAQSGDGGNASTETPPSTSTPAGGDAGTAAASGEVSIAVGERVFKERCEMCHGASGHGDGPAGAALNPKPRNMTDKAYMTGLTDQKIHDTILNGKPGTAMPAHKDLVTEAEVQSLILKVRSFSQS